MTQLLNNNALCDPFNNQILFNNKIELCLI